MQLQNMAQQATCSPERVVNTVLHVIDRECLREAARQTHKSRAPGMDHVTAPQDAAHVDEHVRALPERLRDNRSVAPPVARGLPVGHIF